MNAFERHPRLAAWMERLANANIEGMTLIAWDDFCSAVNEAVFPTPPQPANGEVVGALRHLTRMARTSGGVASADRHLMGACSRAEAALDKLEP